MIKRHNLKLTAMSLVIGAALLGGCTSTTTSAATVENAAAVGETETGTDKVVNEVVETMPKVTYEEDDAYTSWKNEAYTTITLGTDIKVQGNGASTAENKVTISKAGTYVLSGKLEDGQIIVDTKDSAAIRLILNGVEIKAMQNAPVYVKSAGKVVISLEEGTQNIITDTANYVFAEGEDEPNAALFSKADLTINGTGTLTVNGNYEDAIVTKDRLKIMEGNLIINCQDDGIRGKDMVAIKNGDFTIISGGDAIKSTNSNNADKGFILIENGVFKITAEGDGIQAETSLNIVNGDFNITTGGGSTHGKKHVDSTKGGMKTFNQDGAIKENAGMRGNKANIPESKGMLDEAAVEKIKAQHEAQQAAAQAVEQTTAAQTAEEETVSTKAVKAGTKLVIDEGKFTINAADDALHSNGEVTINNGEFNIATGDDGIHGDTVVVINSGNINITKCYEGIEGQEITINGGHTVIVSDDDGINAADGSEAAPGTTKNINLTVNDGYLFISAHGDGLDSNGNMTLNGGTVVANALIGKGENALDYDGQFAVTGGIFATTGGANLNSKTSTQKVISMSFNSAQEANTIVCVQDSNNNIIVAFAPDRSFSSIYISSEKFDANTTYTVSYGGTITNEGTDGLYLTGTYSGGTKVGTFKLQDAITYLNETGVTTAPATSQNGGGKGNMLREERRD